MTRLLIRNAGHEVRTPLNSIINYLEVALEETLDEPARHHLQKSLQASKSLVFVVNDLLNLTEAEDANFNVHEDNVDLKDMLLEVVGAFETEAAKRNTRVVLEADISVPWIVICDPGNLRTVLSNLLANAIKHSSDSLVRVTTEETNTSQTDSSIEISFHDQGTGLTEQQLNRIFLDFERIMDDDDESSVQPIESNETRRHEIGLGLAITARFVRLNNGQISIWSDGEGKGTTVSISLPFKKPLQGYLGKRKLSHSVSLPTPPTDPNFDHPHIPSDNTFMGSPSPEPTISEGSAAKDIRKLVGALPSNPVMPFDVNSSSTSTTNPLSQNSPETSQFPFLASKKHQVEQKLTILVAEDNPLNSQLLETRLRRRGHEVRVAVNGQDCFDAYKRSPAAFDVVLMDIQVSS